MSPGPSASGAFSFHEPDADYCLWWYRLQPSQVGSLDSSWTYREIVEKNGGNVGRVGDVVTEFMIVCMRILECFPFLFP